VAAFHSIVLKNSSYVGLFASEGAVVRNDLPKLDEILEELADKAATHIDRLAPVAFDRAWKEMTRYHQFLLALNASRDPTGAAFSYAEVVGDDWHAPHREWIRQYSRLLERAASRIPDDSHFIEMLAYAPVSLLSRPGGNQLPPRIVQSILDLGPMMVHRLETWVTKRTTFETSAEQPPKPRIGLASSDAKSYSDVLPNIIGAWERLLQLTSSIYGWTREAHSKGGNAERWSAFRASWPFLWRHLSNTAHCLAIAVWNEDEAGAAFYSEALVRWPETLGHRPDQHLHLRSHRLLFPDIFNIDWSEASAHASRLSYDYMPPPTPDQLLASIVRSSHNDVLILTAAIFLHWTLNEKQISDISGRTALALLRRDFGDEDHSRPTEQQLGLRSLFPDLIRLDIAGDGHGKQLYSSSLDDFIASLDNMTERRVVPGRVYTPSTAHHRDDLVLPFVAMMLASTPDDETDGLKEWVAELARDEDALPNGDRSLRKIVQQLELWVSTLNQFQPKLSRGVSALAPLRDADLVTRQLSSILNFARTTIEAARLERLKERPVSVATLERIRSTIEASLLKDSTKARFSISTKIERAPHDASIELREFSITGISKAQLIAPPMETTSSNFEEMLTSIAVKNALSTARATFARRHRDVIDISAKVEEGAFWRSIAPLIDRIGSYPVLLVSRAAEGRALRRILYGSPTHRPNLRVEQRELAANAGSYIATIEGVDVFGSDLSEGVAWLFSGQALRKIQYAELNPLGHFVDVKFVLDHDLQGTLKVSYRRELKWTEAPIFELRTLDPGDREDNGSA
jgi:hypothetical protein